MLVTGPQGEHAGAAGKGGEMQDPRLLGAPCPAGPSQQVPQGTRPSLIPQQALRLGVWAVGTGS